MKNIKKILFRKVYPHPGLIVAAGMLIVMLITAIGGMLNYGSELDSKYYQPSPALVKKSPEEAVRSGNNIDSPTTKPPSGKSEVKSSSTPNQSARSASNSPHNSVQAASPAPQQKQNISVSLRINNSFKGEVEVASGSNHCQVLSGALSQGVISSLDMRYNSQYGSYAVYVINGVGDPGSVWWTYQVNGQSAPYGCGHVVAKAGDQVNWNYIK